MALKKRLGTHTFEWDGSSINLRSSLSNIEALEKATGTSWYNFMNNVGTAPEDANGNPDPSAAFKPFVDLFYYFQEPDKGEDLASRDDIWEAFFANIHELIAIEFQQKLTAVMAGLMGLDSHAVLAELDKKMAELQAAMGEDVAQEADPKKKAQS